MGAGHSHGHGHAGARHRWRLAAAFGLVATFFVIELVVAMTSGSLALLSDAGHMAADVVALGAALMATRIATRPDNTGRRTYGSYRAEIFASGFTVLLMIGLAIYVAIETLRRLGDTPEVAAGPMLVVGALGLLINLISLSLLRAGASESLNVKGAYFEVIADTVGSLGVIAAGILVSLTGSSWWDTAIALGISLFIAIRAVILGREVLAVLGQHAPPGIDPDDVAQRLSEVEGVSDVHDLHVWALTSGMNVATCHLMTDPQTSSGDVLIRARETLRSDFHIEHATLQVERSASECDEITW
ncbi:cation diffusion facilitator family transporter [Demetria terragena]|uniref:cation diffusion facilitator family transporter n=1 Tax=Demetria terragena TaxID=63959 RepID=UPI00036087DC|nr:cation diffusion facilitator family transporter [Demetria terragena]